MSDYADFLARKALIDPPTGLRDIPSLCPQMHPFQRDLAAWALRRGRAAIFAGTGLGKTLQELAWADAIVQATGGMVLILAPLAVPAQTVAEGRKFGIQAHHIRAMPDATSGVFVASYSRMDHFDLSRFAGVVLDESSILKSQDGATRTALIDRCRDIPYRLCATATPAPNDFMELGNHAEFLGIMSFSEMLSTFFVHDGGETQKWRLKGHASSDFWRWMCSWAVMLRHPRDLGYDTPGYDLPPLRQHQRTVRIPYRPSIETGLLFPMEAVTLRERIGARRDTVAERVVDAANLINAADDVWVAWCNLNAESDALVRAIDGAVEIRGSMDDEDKESILAEFAGGGIRRLVTKASMTGFGLNWQHCHKTAYVGLNDSYEQVYQSVRRFWRYGQAHPVDAYFIAAETEGAVVANLKRKEDDADRMAAEMVDHMADLSSEEIRGTVRMKIGYHPNARLSVPVWVHTQQGE